MNVFGPYCAISEEPLYDIAYVWDKRTNSEFPPNRAASQRWDDLLLLSPATCDAWRRHHNRPSSEVMVPDQEITFRLEDSPLVYSLETVDVVLVDESGEPIPSSVKEELVIVQGKNEKARATIDTFSLNTEYFDPQTKELRIPDAEYRSRRDAPLRSRAVAWQRARDAADLISNLSSGDRRPLMGQLQVSAAATGHWSVWATVLWDRLRDPELLASVLGGRSDFEIDGDLIGFGPHNEFPGTARGWLPETERTAVRSASQ